MENSSGQGALATVPAEIDRWNWGAFLLNWIWGIFNQTYIAFLMFVPFVNFVMPFVLGVKGSAWAWRNRRWQSVEEFKAVQRKWAIWSVVVYLLLAVFLAGALFAVLSAVKSSDAYKLAVTRAEASQEIIAVTGSPLSPGFPLGSIRVSGHNGSANLSFSLSGPKGRGTVYLDAARDLGQWKINRMVFEESGTGRRIDLR